MGAKSVKCCTNPDDYGMDGRGQGFEESSPLKINEFQLCKKGEIHQEKIVVWMRV